MHLTKESSLTEPRISRTAHFLTRSKKTPQAREEKFNINAAKSLLEALTSIWGFKSSSLNLRTRSFYAKRRQINFPLRRAPLSAPAAWILKAHFNVRSGGWCHTSSCIMAPCSSNYISSGLLCVNHNIYDLAGLLKVLQWIKSSLWYKGSSWFLFISNLWMQFTVKGVFTTSATAAIATSVETSTSDVKIILPTWAEKYIYSQVTYKRTVQKYLSL